MSENEESKNDIHDLIQELKTLQVCYVNSSHVQVRCPYCGDSIKNPTHAHLNIRISDPNVIVWRCVRCETGGILTPEFLRDLELGSSDTIRFAYKHSKNFAKHDQRDKLFGMKPKMILPVKKSKISKQKLSYFNDRMGLSLSMTDAVTKYKLVVDFEELHELNPWLNKLTKHLKNDNFYRLQDEGLGFVSHDNSTIIFRDIVGNWEKRYFNLHLYGKSALLEDKILYTLPTNLELMSLNHNVVITEGIMSLIGTREFVWNTIPRAKRDDPTMFISANGKSYPSVMKFVRHIGIAVPSVYIFSDSDVTPMFLRKMFENDPSYKKIRLFYNANIPEGEKKSDFGVNKSEIELEESSIYG